MADNINDWQEVGTSTQPQAAASAAPMSSGEDWQEVPLQPIDELTTAEVPLPYSGLSPDTARNKSVVSTMDRMKLSLGNVQGNIKYLKAKFQDVKPIDGSEDLAVMKDGSWYRVDPVNGDIDDPWEMAKEYVKDMSELGPMVAGGVIGAGTAALLAPAAAAGTVATGGVAAPAAASGTYAAVAGAAGLASAGVRTSLGRIVGTYDATPAEQAYDMAFEGLLNMAGEKVLAGVKPTAKWVSTRLGPMAEAFKDTLAPIVDAAEKNPLLSIEKGGVADAIINSPKAVMKKLFASFSVGEDNFDTMVENTDKVKNTMQALASRGGHVQAYHDQAINDQVQSVRAVADGTRSTLSKIYDSMRNQVLKDVPENFSVNLDTPVYDSYIQAFKNGIGKIETPQGTLMGKDAAEYLATTKSFKFSLLSREDMAKTVAAGADLDSPLAALATSQKGYDATKEFYNEISKFVGGAPRSGQAGAKALLDFKKLATNIAYDIETSEPVRGSQAVKSLISQARHNFDDSVFNKLKDIGVADKWTDLNATYNSLSKEFAPLLAAKNAYDRGNPKAYEPLLNSFLARPRPGATARFAIDSAIDAANTNGLKAEAAKLTEDKLNIQVLEAAKAFNPIKSGILKADTLGINQVAVATYAVRNPEYIPILLGITALRTPQAAKVGVAVSQTLSKGQEFLNVMPKKAMNQFLSDPKLMQSFTTGLMQAPIVRAKADQVFQQLMQQAQQGAQPDGQ